MYEGESVNRTKTGIKGKQVISKTEKKTIISRHILHQHWYTCPIALLMCRNPQRRSLLTVLSAISASPFQPLRHQQMFATFLCPILDCFTLQTLPTVKWKHLFMNILCIESFSSLITHNRTLLFCGIHLKHWLSSFWLLKPVSEHAHARLLPRLSWSWTVLLPSDTHTRPITCITAVYFHLWLIYWHCLVYIRRLLIDSSACAPDARFKTCLNLLFLFYFEISFQ
jgi:hypothetical protein